MPQKGHIRYEPAKIGIFSQKKSYFLEKKFYYFLLTILSTRSEVEKSTGY